MSSQVSSKNNIETTKEKEYKKYINFGKLYISDSTFLSNESNYINKLKDDINLKFKKSNQYSIDKMYDRKLDKIVDKDEKLEFTKLSSSENHFFGTFTRVSNNKDVLTDIIDNKSNEKIDPNTIYFEYNTLFYIDFSNSAISFIKTQHIKNVYPFLETFLNNNNFLNIKIAPLLKTEEEIKDSIITQVEVTYSRTAINPNTDFIDLKTLEKMGCTVGDYKLSVSLKEVKNNFSAKLLNFRKKNSKNIKKLSILTQSENIDLMTNTFTKSVPIKLNNNYEKDYRTIENTLSLELSKAIER